MNTLIVVRCIRTEAGIHRLSPSLLPPHPFHRLLNVFQRISAVIFIAETIRPWTAVYRLGYDEELEQPSPPYSPWLCRGKLRGEILENWRSGGGVAVACSGNWCSSCSRRNCLVLSANLADARRESSGSSVCESRERKGSAQSREEPENFAC